MRDQRSLRNGNCVDGGGSGAGPRFAAAVATDTHAERWPTGTFARAEQLIAQHRYREAIAFCRQELAASPRCVTLRLLLAKALLDDGSGAAGVAQLEECVRIDPAAEAPRKLLMALGVEPPLPPPRKRTPSITPLPPPPVVPPIRAVPPKPAPRPVAKAPVAQAPAPRPPARPTPQPAAKPSGWAVAQPMAPVPASPRVIYSAPAMAAPAMAAMAAPAAQHWQAPPPLQLPPLQAAPMQPMAQAVTAQIPSPPMFELPKLQPLKQEPVRVAHDPPGRARQRRRTSSNPFVEAPKPSRAAARWERPLSIEQRRPQPLFKLGLVAIAVAGLLALWRLGREEARTLPTAAVAASRPTPEPPLAPKPATPLPLDGTIAGDLWIHPLAGPERRMPERDSRLFGAERVGDRPSECRGGHCGVDLAGSYGEPVYAVHDGVVDRVQRALNPDHGGRYVRLAHRDGTIITEYFHLSEIPRRIVEGAAVKAGDVVGFVGLTGVKRSEPHLHFTIEVQDPSGNDARYLDPEPLVALWPLRVSSKGDDRLHVSTAPPGLARGFLRRRHRHRATAAD